VLYEPPRVDKIEKRVDGFILKPPTIEATAHVFPPTVVVDEEESDGA
jgi:hypothetical protein